MAMIFLLGVTDTLGHVTYTEYDELNRVKRTWRNYLPGYPQNHQETYNLVTTYGYNPVGNQTHVTDTLGHVTYTEYDALNRPITVTTNYVDGIFDPARPDEDIIQVTVYDPETGQPVAQVDTIGRETRTDYDAAGRPVTVTTNYVDGIYDPARPDEDTQQVTHYDPETGRVTARWQIAEMAIPTRYEYDVLGRRITTTNALSGTTVTHYDALGRRSETIDAEGHVTQYDYDAAGRLIATTNALSGTTVTHYDALGRRVATTDQLGHTTIYTHNAAGQLTAQADPLGNVTHYDYDVLGRRTAITDADGVATTSYYDSLGRLTRTCDALDNCTHYAYNALGNRTVMTDANGIATKYMYNDRGRLVAVIENWQAGGPINEQVNVRTDYAYDISGNLQVITDALGHTTVYTYDLAGRRVAEADPLGNVTEYHYDGHGRRVGEIYPDDSGPITVTTAYDALGRPTEIAYPAVGSVSGFAVEIDYDAMGNRRSVTDATGSTTYDYNALYQPLGIAAPAGDAHYEYDAAGRRTHLIYPTGEVVTYTHNAAGRLRTVTDWDGGVTIYTYTAAGRLSRIELPNGVCTDYSYDDAGRLQRIKHFKGKQLLSLYTYVLDPIGNRTMVTEEMVTEQTITPVGDASVQSDSAATYVGSSFGIQMDGVVSEFRHPDVASLEEDPYINEEQYLSVWLGYPGFGTGPVVYGRTVSSSGAMGTHLIIRNNTSGNVVQYQQPRVAYDPTAGRALVLWKEGDDIYGRLVNMRTTPPTLVGLQPFIVADGNEKQSVNYAAVAAHPLNGNFLVVYERSEASDDVYGQFVTSSGTLEGNAFEIASDALDPDVDFYPNRRQFMVIWETIEDKENPSNIQGRLVEEERLGSIFTVYPSATGQYDPAVSYNAINQRFLVVWDENGIKGRQITTSGGYGSLISISSYGSVPDVGGNGVNGNWLVSWSSFQVYAHEINSSGVLTGDLLTFGIGETSQIIAVSHASPESGRYLTVWGQTDDIMGKLVGPNLVAGFRASPTSGSDPLTVHFTDTTQLPGMADQWLWDFGDGTQSTTQHPEKTYTHPGVYTVQLTATDQDTEDTDSVYLTQGITVVNSEIFETRTITYTYDPLNRLTAADYSTGESFAYAYDAVGNRTAMTDTAGVHTYTYDAANRLTEIQHPDASIETYTWDARGNLIGDGAFTYDYNAA
ncbi:MAG: PKD domain-containing protein, partial [Anaerolineales bacterium]